MAFETTNKEYSEEIPLMPELNKSKLEKLSSLGKDEIWNMSRVIKTSELFTEENIGTSELINKISGYLVMKESKVGYYLGLFEEIKNYGTPREQLISYFSEKHNQSN